MRRLTRHLTWLLAVTVIAVLLMLLPGRAAIVPAIQADNNYIYLAADRLYAGLGPTSIRPQAPLQPWEWHGDWSFLTQWPLGYPLLLCAFRLLLRCSTVQAGQAIAIISCAIALVGWFAWARRVTPKGIAGTLLAVAAAGSAVSTAALVNPATDTIIIALLPLVLLLAQPAVCETAAESDVTCRRRRYIRIIAAGLFAGGLCWIRYAAIYVPAGIGVLLAVRWMARRGTSLRQVGAFAFAAAVPLVALVLVNRAFGSPSPLQDQLNLGSRVGFTPDPTVFATIWWQFADLPFYDYHWYSHWAFAVGVPVGVLGILGLRPAWRKGLRAQAGSSGYALSACVLVAMFAMLAAVSVLFRSKHTYVDIPRYYAAARPLYFLLIAGPLIAVTGRTIRAAACIPLLLCVSWYIQVEWPRPYRRWLAADRPVTDYGRWAWCFEPGGNELYRWLREQNDPHLIVFSNFHDEIAVETWVPACPLPETEDQLARWVRRICDARNIDHSRVLFALDPSNHTRAYYLPPPRDVVTRFGLTPCPSAPESVRPYVFDYSPSRPRLVARPRHGL